MGKLTAIKTKSIFQSLLNDSSIDEQSIHFILDTGQIYTHGTYINGAAYGTEANGAVNLSIAGVTKALSLSTHTHSTYLEKNSNIDIGSYVIKSGNNELLKWASSKLILGSPTYITGTAHTTRNSTNYDILDTGNFSVVAKTSTNISLQNVATIKYGSSTFQIDYAKRINGAYTFDNITYTSIGTTNVNNQQYGIITMYTDGSTPASYAQIRADIPNGKLEYRTSGSTAWKTIVTGALPTVFVGSGSSHASGLVPDPGATAGTAKFLCEDGTWKTPTYTSDTNTWRNILVNGTQKLSTAINSGGLDIINGTNTTVEWTSASKLKINAVNTWIAFVGASANSAGTAGYVSAPGQGNQGKYFRGDGTWATPTNTWNAANTSQAGYIPKLATGGGTISTQASEYVLVYVSSGTGTVTPTWKLLPANAFKNDNTWNLGSSSQAGYVPQATKNYFLHCNNSTGALEWVANPNSNTWRGIYVGGASKVGTGTGTLPINFVAGSNVTITYEAAGTGSGQSGNAGYFNIKIAATNTWTAWKGATDSAAGTAGYMPAPTSAQRGQFLRGDGSWVSLNNYSLPTASSSTLGGVKTGAAITDTTGYTAVAIKDGVIYYKDTNTTYTFSNLQFQQTSGTNLMTYNSQAARTILAGSNITFTHSSNVLTITAKDTTYSTVSKSAAGLCPALPNETTTTKYLRQDGSWVAPPNDNTWKAANASQEGYVPKSTANKILRADANGALYWGDDANTTYTFYNLQFQNSGGTTVDTYKPTTSPTKTLKAGSNITISAASNIITIASTNTWTPWAGATSSANGTAGYMPAPTSAQRTQFLRGDGTWVSLNNYSLPTASSSALGGVKTGAELSSTDGYTACGIKNGVIYYKDTNTTYSTASSSTAGLVKTGSAISDTSGYTACPIKDGVIYYKDTNTTYTFYNLAFQNGDTVVDTYKPTTSPSKTLKAGTNVTISAASNVITISSSYTNTQYKLTLNGTAKGTTGGTDLGSFYAVATSDATAKDQVWMRNSSNNGYAWRTLGSHAFDSTTYATPDTTTTLTRASGNLTKDTWADAGTFADSVAEGTWVVSFTVDGSIYSGVFSRKKSDTMSEEITLHAAGTSTKRIYARTTGNKFQIVTADDTFNPGAITFNFRKLI